MAALPWTLIRIIDKVRDDVQLHAEDFVTYADMVEFVNDAIDDAEEIVVDTFSDFLLTYEDLDLTIGDRVVDLPVDIYESRFRWLAYSEQGFDTNNVAGDKYKLTKLKLERMADVDVNDPYQYRLINTTADGQKLYIYPPVRVTSDYQFRLFYIRQFRRLEEQLDVLEKGLRPQYIIAHVKCAVLRKMADPMLDVEVQNLMKQEDKLKNSMSRLTDDDEDILLEPDEYSLDEAYGEWRW